MQYLVAAGLVLFFLALWIGVDALYRKKGFKDRQGRSTACPDCTCASNTPNGHSCERPEKDHL